MEGLFGVRWNVPSGELKLEPCLPLTWSNAQIKLENLDWRIKHRQNRWTGIIKTTEPIGRTFRVKLPPCNIESCLVGGKEGPYSLEPTIDGVFVIVVATAECETQVSIMYQPVPITFEHETDVAAGDPLTVNCRGAKVVEVIDRSRIAQTVSIADDRVEISMAEDTVGLRPTVFLRCRCGQTEFYHPLQLSVHKTLEVSPASDASKVQHGYAVDVALTNWTNKPAPGRYCLKVLDQQADEEFKMDKGVTEKLRLPLSEAAFEKLSPGMNTAHLELPGGEQRDLEFRLLAPFGNSAALRATLAGRLEQIDLGQNYSHSFEELKEKKEALIERAVAPDRVGPQFLSEISPDQQDIADPGTGLGFRIGGRQVVLAAHGSTAKVPLNGPADKIYVLTVSCLGSEDTYAQVGKIGVTYEDGAGKEVALRIPGNIKWGYYYRGWESSLKWYQGLAIVLPGTVLDILEVPCDSAKTVRELYLATLGRTPAIGMLGVTVLTPC